MRKFLLSAILLCITFNLPESTAQTTDNVVSLGAGFITHAAWSSDGTQFAVSTHAFLLLYDASLTLQHQLQPELFQGGVISWRPQGELFAVTSGYTSRNRIYPTGAAYVLNISGDVLHMIPFDDEYGSIQAVWSNDGTRVVFPAVNNDGLAYSLHILDVESGDLQVFEIFPLLLVDVSEWTWSDDDTRLTAYVPQSGLEQTIDANTGEVISFENNVEREQDELTSPDGMITATLGQDGVEVTSSARNLGDFTLEAEEGVFDAMVWSPDSRYLAAIGEESNPNVLIANAQTGDVVLQTLIDYPGNIRNVLFQPQGDRAIFTTEFSDVFLYDLNSGEQIAQRWYMTGSGSISLHPDGVRLAVATERSQNVYIWNAITREEMRLFDSPNEHTRYNFLYSVAWSPDGRYLATGAIGGGEDDTSGPIDLFVWDAETGAVIQRIPAVSYDFTTISEINWSADSTMFAWTTSPGRNDHSHIGAWNVVDETMIYQQALDVGVTDIALNPTGTQLALIAYNYDNDIPVTLETLDLTTGAFLEPVDLQTTDNELSIDWHPDGRHIALLQQVYEDGGYGRITIFDRETNTTFNAPIMEQVRLTITPYLAWSPDGTRLATPFRAEDEINSNAAINGALVYDVFLETEEIALQGRYERDRQLSYGIGNGTLSWAADGTIFALSASWEEILLVKIEP